MFLSPRERASTLPCPLSCLGWRGGQYSLLRGRAARPEKERVATALAALILLALLTLGPLQPAQAETVYRCENRYSDMPCHGGEAIVIEDTRSAAQQAESRRYTQRDTSLADALEAERIAFEEPAPPPEANAQRARKTSGAHAATRAGARAASRTDMANQPSARRRPPPVARPPADFKAVAPAGTPSYATEAAQRESD